MTGGDTPAVLRVLVVCTANRCRSPMAEGLLRLRGGSARWRLAVTSAGFLAAGAPCPDEASEELRRYGVDLAGHRSRTIDASLVDRADLVATMTRDHLLDAALLAGERWDRCFTLHDLVARAESTGGPLASEVPAAWVSRLHSGRRRVDLVRLDPADDISDPYGRRASAYARTARRLDDLVVRFATVLGPGRATAAAP